MSARLKDLTLTFSSSGHRRQHHLRHDRNRMLHFDFSEVPPEMAVTGAELRLFKRGRRGNRPVTIEVYRVYEDHRRM